MLNFSFINQHYLCINSPSKMSIKLKLYNRNCPSCRSADHKLFYSNKNFEKIDATGKKYLVDKFYVTCKKCNLVYTNPTVRPSVFDKIYENSIVGSFNSIKNSKPNLKKFKYFTDLVDKSIIKNKKILDIGCGQAELLKNISKKYKISKKKIFAIEPSKKIYNYLKKNTSINVKNTFLDRLNDKIKYDFLILDNVFEHFEHPHKSLKKMQTILSKNGYVYVSVPNVLKPDFEYEDPLNHTCNYYKNNIINLFANNNFKVIRLITTDTLINFIAVKQEGTISKINLSKDAKKFTLLRKKILKNKKKKQKKNTIIIKKGNQIKQRGLKIIIFGSGNYSLELLTKMNIDKNILGYIDSNRLYHGLVRNGHKVYGIQQLKNLNFDKIIVASNKYKMEIYSLLIRKKINKEKIVLF